MTTTTSRSSRLRDRTRKGVVLGALLTLSASPLPGGTKPLEIKDFELRKDGLAEVIFNVGEPGTLKIRVRVEKPIATAPAALRLTGPDGIQVDKQGSAPLRLRYDVSSEEQFGSWRATVMNVGKMSSLTGQVQVTFAASTPGRDSVPPTRATDGEVTYPQTLRRGRAVCRDRNQDVSVRFDLERGTGGLYMKYNRAFALAPKETSGDVIELGGSGETPLYLDTDKKVLFFRGGEKGVFCRVRIYYGES